MLKHKRRKGIGKWQIVKRNSVSPSRSSFNGTQLKDSKIKVFFFNSIQFNSIEQAYFEWLHVRLCVRWYFSLMEIYNNFILESFPSFSLGQCSSFLQAIEIFSFFWLQCDYIYLEERLGKTQNSQRTWRGCIGNNTNIHVVFHPVIAFKLCIYVIFGSMYILHFRKPARTKFSS